MMTPVGRLIMVRSVDKKLLVNAMSLRDHPGADRPDLRSAARRLHHHLCLVALDFSDQRADRHRRHRGWRRATSPMCEVEHHDPFDFIGFILSGLAIAGLAFGLSVMGLDFLPVERGRGAHRCRRHFGGWPMLFTARRVAAPILDLSLLKLPTFRASIVGGFLFRIGIGALPFLLPLLLQIGFRSDAVPIRPHHLHHRARLDVHEGRGGRRAQSLRLPQCADLQCADQQRIPRRLRRLPAGRALCGNDRDPAVRRLFPLAAIHQHQHDCLCGGRTAADQPRHHDGRCCATIGALDRRRRRRPGRRDYAAAERTRPPWA